APAGPQRHAGAGRRYPHSYRTLAPPRANGHPVQGTGGRRAVPVRVARIRRAAHIMIQAEVLKDCPRVRHGFLTRQGGVSSGIYASLNCGYGSKDRTNNITEKRPPALPMISLPP